MHAQWPNNYLNEKRSVAELQAGGDKDIDPEHTTIPNDQTKAKGECQAQLRPQRRQQSACMTATIVTMTHLQLQQRRRFLQFQATARQLQVRLTLL
jgi:hypothetical protein